MALAIPYRAVLVDLEGTLYDANGPVSGAAEALEAVRAAGLRVGYLTNTTRRSRAGLVARLAELGFDARPEELFTAVTAAADWCRSEGRFSVLPLLAPEALEDLEGLQIVPVDSPNSDAAAGHIVPRPQAVVVGDLGPAWTFEALNVAFRCLRDGAELIACQKNRFWETADGPTLDAGPFVAALEYAASRSAVVAGKPAASFFRSALAGLGVQPREAVMVGDDAEADVGGAIEAGLSGWLVRTGKYRPGDESRVSPWPECVLESVAELPDVLGI